MAAVVDADYFIHAAIAGKLKYVLEKYGKIVTTAEIYHEVVTKGKGRPGSAEMEDLCDRGLLEIVDPDGDYKRYALAKGIDLGEASGIHVAKKEGHIFLTDDRRATIAARAESICVEGIENLFCWILKNKYESRDLVDHEIALLQKGKYKIKEKVFTECLQQ